MAFPAFLYHIIFGTTALFLCVITVLIGAMFSGRIGDSKGHKELYKLHKYSGIITGIFVVFTFIFMILPPYFSGQSIILGIHGWIAVFALIIVIIQISLSLLIKVRTKLRNIHLYLGYILLILLTLQVINGLILASL